MAYLNLDKDHLALSDFEKLLTINPGYPGGKDWWQTLFFRGAVNQGRLYEIIDKMTVENSGLVGMPEPIPYFKDGLFD